MADALFIQLDDNHYDPTGFGRGPWDPGAHHGGAVAALCAHAGEVALAATGAPAVSPVRLTLDIERPVPVAPLTVETTIVRPGKKVQVAEVVVSDDAGRRLARASVLAIRRLAVDLPDDLITPDDVVPKRPTGGAPGPSWPFQTSTLPAFHSHGTEHQFVKGAFTELGPCTDWIRLAVGVIEGVEVTPFQRVVAASDFLNGVSSVVSPMEWTFINPDVTVTIHRLPVGEWVGIDAVTRLDSFGVGTAEADLYDVEGRIGRAVQTLLIEPR